jgi:SAM-dependent methyltransferase
MSNQSLEDVFTQIYGRNLWGGQTGSFHSGSGTHDDAQVQAYIDAVTQLGETFGFLGAEFVDLGCGDMRVGRHLIPLSGHYIGVDIVAPLIERNTNEFGNASVSFSHLDATRDDLPIGRVCFLRQVLQHLSNDEILRILIKLKQYEFVIVSEHLPNERSSMVPNRDKPHGSGIRLYNNSGVVLTAPPFDIPEAAIKVVLEAPLEVKSNEDPGVIQTVLYQPGITHGAR